MQHQKSISSSEYFQALVTLALAIVLQVVSTRLNRHLYTGLHYAVICTETAMAFLIGLSSVIPKLQKSNIHRFAALLLLVCLSAANLASLVVVLHSLIIANVVVTGLELLSASVAIFLTNIIVFAIWYWEIDSPGFSNHRWTRSDRDFQFTQQDLPHQHAGWRPEFIDYLYVSLTNAVNFAPADARPLTKTAKLLMGSQALVSVFTLALVVARSVSILGV